jgi:hypothetical protein
MVSQDFNGTDHGVNVSQDHSGTDHGINGKSTFLNHFIIIIIIIINSLFMDSYTVNNYSSLRPSI